MDINIPKILLVDDSRFFLEVEKSLLAVSPVQLLTAADGQEALEIVKTVHPDLVIMDIVMPRMDGKACCVAIKADPLTCSIPVIMVANCDRPEDITACLEAGCTDYLLKPLDKKSFLEKIRKILPVIDRRNPRINCQLPVTLQFGDTLAMVECGDLSVEGMYVKSNLDIKEGTGLDITFNLPGESAITAKIQAKGHVAWLNRQSNVTTGFGIQLDEIIGEGLAMLRKKDLAAFIEANRKKS